MNPIVQIFAIILGVALVGVSIESLRKRRLSELQTGLWLLTGLVAMIVGVFPGIIIWIAGLLGITWPPAILLLLAIVVLGLIVFGRTREINDLSSKQIELTEQLSLTRYQVQCLEERLQSMEAAPQQDEERSA